MRANQTRKNGNGSTTNQTNEGSVFFCVGWSKEKKITVGWKGDRKSSFTFAHEGAEVWNVPDLSPRVKAPVKVILSVAHDFLINE